MTEWDHAINAIRNHGRYICGGVLIGAIIAILILVFQTPQYRAEMIVAPTDRTGVPSLSSFLPKAAADAPALQYFVERIDASQSTDFTVFETVLLDADTIDKLKSNTQFNLSDDPYNYIKRHVKIRSHGMTPFRKITITHDDPEIAKLILMGLYQYADDSVRLDKKIKTNRRIQYLNDQLDKTRNPDHRDAMIALLKEQEQTSMMASIDNNFAAQIISAPYASQKPISPNWKILFPILIFAGGFLGLMVGGFCRAFKK